MGVGGFNWALADDRARRLEAGRLAARKVARACPFLDPQDLRQEAALTALAAPGHAFQKTAWYAKEYVRGQLLYRLVGAEKIRRLRENEYARDLPSPTTLAARANAAKSRVGRQSQTRGSESTRSGKRRATAAPQNLEA